MNNPQSDEFTADSPFRVLTLDGGPSTFTMLHIIRKLEQEHTGFLEGIHMFAGASSGAFASLYLAKALADLSDSKGAEGNKGKSNHVEIIDKCIDFCKQMIDCFQPRPLDFMRFITGSSSSLLDSKALASKLKEHLGETTLDDLAKHKKFVSIQVFNATQGRTSSYTTSSSTHGTMKLYDVAISSSAIHPLLSISQDVSENAAGQRDVVTDSGLFNNTPILSALQDAVLARRAQRQPSDENAFNGIQDGDLRDLTMLSMGARVIYPTFTRAAKTFTTFFERINPHSVHHVKSKRTAQPLVHGEQRTVYNFLKGGFEKLIHGRSEESALLAVFLLGDHGFHRFTPIALNRFDALVVALNPELSKAMLKYLADSLLNVEGTEGSSGTTAQKIEQKASFRNLWNIPAGMTALFYVGQKVFSDDGLPEAKQAILPMKDWLLLVDWLKRAGWIQTQKPRKEVRIDEGEDKNEGAKERR